MSWVNITCHVLAQEMVAAEIKPNLQIKEEKKGNKIKARLLDN